MKIQVSESSFKKGQRAVAKIDDNEWYAGQITLASRDGSKITFLANDGEEYKIDGQDLIHVHLIAVEGKKEKYTDDQASKLFIKPSVDNTKPVKTLPFAKGQKVIVKFEDGLEGPTVVGALNTKDGKVGVWRGRGNLVWVDVEKVSAVIADTTPKLDTQKEVTKEWTDEVHKPLEDLYSKAVSESQYSASKCLGRMFDTGRRGPTGRGVIIALGTDKSSYAIIWTPHVDSRLRFLRAKVVPKHDLDQELATRFRITGSQVPYDQFVNYREQFLDATQVKKSRAVSRQHLYDKAKKEFDIDKIVGKQALIKWDRGYPSWQIVLKYDSAANKIGIQGSRTRLRWIPISYIIDVRAAP